MRLVTAAYIPCLLLHRVNAIVVNSRSFLFAAYGKVLGLNKSKLRTDSLDALLEYHTLPFLFRMYYNEQHIIDQAQWRSYYLAPPPPSHRMTLILTSL